MKIRMPNPIFLLAICFYTTLGIISSCASKKQSELSLTPVSSGVPYIPMTEARSAPVQPKPDTIKKAVEKPLQLPKTGANDYANIDSLRKQNYEVVNSMLYIIGRNKVTREQRDSLYEIVKAVQDTLNVAAKRSKDYYAAKKETHELYTQNKIYSDTVKYQVYIAGIIFLILWSINTYLISRISKKQKLASLS